MPVPNLVSVVGYLLLPACVNKNSITGQKDQDFNNSVDKLTVGRMDSEVAQLLLLMLTASVEPKRAAPLNSVTAIAAELIFGAVLVAFSFW